VGGTRSKDVRDLAAMLVGRDLLARASELVTVTVEALSWDEEDGTATVNLLRGKTHQERETYLLGPDAAQALRRWLEVSGITAGPVFVALEKSGKPRTKDGTVHPIAPREVSRILKGLGKRARLEADFSAHSLRVGMAQDMVAENIEGAAIMQAAGWKSPTMLTRYTRKQNAKRGAVAQYHAARRHK
jgi:integrase